MTFDLPYPPSVNHYWAASGKRRYISHAGRKFRRDAFCLIKSQRPVMTARAVCLTILVWPPDHRRRDLDNILKPVLDVLQYAGVIKDDSQVAELIVRRNVVKRQGATRVTVDELA